MKSLIQIRQKILDLCYSHTKSRALSAAVSLGIFQALGDRGRDARSVARSLKTDPRATGLLLNALCGLGFLVKRGERYANLPFGKKLFSEKDPLSLHHIILLNRFGYHLWDRLEESIRTGKPLRRPPFRSQSSKEVESFILAMQNTAIDHAPLLAKSLPLKNVERLIDLGGGPGTFSIHFCKAHPHLKGTLYDLPLTLRVARRMIRRYRLSHRIKTRSGDFLKEPIAGQYDAAFVSHILHGLDEKTNLGLLKKVYGILSEGGRIWIQDFVLDPPKTTPSFASLFALSMLVGSDHGGRSYSFDEIRGWLTQVGFRKIRRLPLRLPRQISVIEATRPPVAG